MATTAVVSARPSWLLALPPLALAAVELWHPVIRSGTAAGIEPLVTHANAWTTIHLAQLALFGLTAWSLATLLTGIRTRLAATARAALGAFAVVYSAFDAFAGLATVAVIQAGQALQPPALPVAVELANAIFTSPINAGLFLVGTASWFLGAGLTGVALWKAGALRGPSVLLLVAAVALWGDHPPPFGPITFGLTAASILWLALRGGAAPTPVSRLAA
jgi:hypothetical protein